MPLAAPPAMLVAVLELPVSAPTKVVDVTEVRPANVVTVAPSATLVEPIVTLLFVSAPFGMPVKLVPVRLGVKVHVGVPVPPDTKTCPEVPAAEKPVVLAAV